MKINSWIDVTKNNELLSISIKTCVTVKSNYVYKNRYIFWHHLVQVVNEWPLTNIKKDLTGFVHRPWWEEANLGDEFPGLRLIRNRSSSKAKLFRFWLFGDLGSLLLISQLEVIVFFLFSLFLEVSLFNIGTRFLFEIG